MSVFFWGKTKVETYVQMYDMYVGDFTTKVKSLLFHGFSRSVFIDMFERLPSVASCWDAMEMAKFIFCEFYNGVTNDELPQKYGSLGFWNPLIIHHIIIHP